MDMLRTQQIDCSKLRSPAYASSICENWFAVSDGKKGDVLLWDNNSEEDGPPPQPRRLVGLHCSKVSALRFWCDGSHSVSLFTASSDCVSKWDIDGTSQLLDVSLFTYICISFLGARRKRRDKTYLFDYFDQ